MSKARYSKKKSKVKASSPTSLQNSLDLSLDTVGMGGLSENKLQKARKFNTDHIIFLNIPKFEITSRIVPKKENFSEKELNEIQTSLETLSTNISTSLKKIQTEIEHILEIQATEDDSNIVQEDDYNLNPEKYSADNTHFTSEEEEEEIGKVDEVLSPLNSPIFPSKDSSGELSPDRLSAIESDTYTRKKNEAPETPVLRKGKSRSSKAKGAKNRNSVAKGSERKKKKKILETTSDDLPAHIPTNFWPHISPFVAPLTFVDIEFLNEKSEELTKEELSLPPLGQIQSFDSNDKVEKKRSKSEKDAKAISNSFYTHRLLAALIEDPTNNSHYTFDQYQTFQSSASSSNVDSENLEEKIINELRNIGLVDDNAKKIDPSQRKDDEICEEIRSTQKRLLELVKLNNQRKSNYLQLAATKMKEQFSDRQLKIKSSHLEKLFSRRMQRNKKRRTKGRTKGGGGRATQILASPTRPILQSLPGKKPHNIYINQDNNSNNNNNNNNNDDEMNNSNNSNIIETNYDMNNSSYFDTSQNSLDMSSPKMDYLDDMDTVPPPPEDDMDFDH